MTMLTMGGAGGAGGPGELKIRVGALPLLPAPAASAHPQRRGSLVLQTVEQRVTQLPLASRRFGGRYLLQR